MSIRPLIVTGVVSVLAGLGSAAPSKLQAEPSKGQSHKEVAASKATPWLDLYTFRSCRERIPVDPVTTVFWDKATYKRVQVLITNYLGWFTGILGSDQSFVADGCGIEDVQLGSSRVFTRYHIRIYQDRKPGARGIVALADPHHEVLTASCDAFPFVGHVVDSNGPNGSGFDKGRDQIVAAFDNAHKEWDVELVDLGNTRNMKQCDGSLAGSDGWVARIRIR